MKPFDEKFGENVREAFDNYQEPVDERAWKQMKKRLKARSKKGIFVMTPFFTTPLFMRAAAAIIFLIAVSGSIWLLVLNQQKPDMATAYEVHEYTPGTTDDITDQAGDERPSVAAIISERPHEDEITSQTVTGDDISTGGIEETRETGQLHGTAGSGETPGALEVADNRYIVETPPVPYAPDMPDSPLVSDMREVSGAMTASDAREVSGIMPASDAREVTGTTFFPPALELPPLSAISGLYSKGVTSYMVASEQLAAEADAFITSRNLESLGEAETRRDRTSIMEVTAGSMKTWSHREIAGGLGYAAGVGGDWHVGRRISIHGGGLLVYNRFSLENTLVSAKHYSDRDFAATPERDMNLGYHILQYQTSDTDVEFTAVDIPVNLRFTVKEMPGSRIFLSAGFSSFLYLQQKYTSESTVLASYHRMTPQGHYVSETAYASLTAEGEFSAFRRFDLARFLNFSGGYVIRGRNQSLIIEPFLKYPLGDVTTLNLNIGMAGLSLKYLPGN